MKTKKIVIGAMAAAMLSLSVCSLVPAFAADETVQISVGSATVEAGGQFTIDVTLSDIPSTGVQACQFSLNYDSSVITIDSIEGGSLLSSVQADPTSSVLPSFNTVVNNKEGWSSIMWATSVDESAYLLQGEGVFCTVTGTVAADAASGVYDITVAPTNRNTYTESGILNEDIDVGYMKDGSLSKYSLKLTNGKITVGDAGGEGEYLRGDANCDGTVNVADATTIVQYLANADKYKISEQGKKNADVTDDNAITGMDALKIQQFEAGIVSEL